MGSRGVTGPLTPSIAIRHWHHRGNISAGIFLLEIKNINIINKRTNIE